MTMTPSVATMRISTSLREAEEALDQALLKQAELMSAMVTARMATDEKAFTGQEQLMRLVKAQQSITASANDLARVHGGMLEIGREMGVIEECPDGGPMRRTGSLVA